MVRQAFLLLENLAACLVADHALEVAHHHRVRVRAVGGAENVVRAPDVRDPVAHRLVDRLLERLLTGLDRHDFRAEHAHAEHVQLLPLAIDRTHVNDALQPEHRGDCGGGDAVLSRAGLGDDAGFAHALGQQNLPHRVVDLVRAGVQQVFALEVDFCAAEIAGEPLSVVERRGASAELAQIILQLVLKLGIVLRAKIFVLQFLQRVHERLGDVPPSVFAKAPVGVRQGCFGNCFHAGNVPLKAALGQAAFFSPVECLPAAGCQRGTRRRSGAWLPLFAVA